MKRQSGKETTETNPVSLTRDLLNRLGHGVVHLDAGLRLTYINETAARLLRKSTEDLTGRTLQDVLPGPLGLKLMEALENTLEGNALTSFEGYYPAPLNLRLNIHCLPSEKGVLVVLHDTTRGKRREEDGGEKKDAPRESKKTPVRDISGQKENIIGCKLTRESIEHTRELFRTVLDNVPVGVAVSDCSGEIILTNKMIEEIYGGPITGTAYGPEGGYRLLTPDGSPFPPEKLPLPCALQSGESSHGAEILIKRDNGSEAVILAAASPIRDNTGKISGAITALQDITKRKQMEESLYESERLFRIMGETVPYGVWLCEPGGDVRYCSQSFLDLIQMTQEEQRQFGWTKRLVPEDVEPMMKKWMNCCQAGSPWEHEHRVIDRNGNICTILSKGLPVRDAEGRITCWVGVNLDISKRKKTEEALRKSEERLRLAQRAGGVGIFDWDMLADTSYWSDEGKKIFGLTGDGIRTGESWVKLVHPDDIDRTREIMAQAILERKTEAEGTYRIIRPDGETRWISSRGVISYDTTGKPVRMIGTSTDITELKNAQESLKSTNEEPEHKVQDRTRELEEANRRLRGQKEELQSILDARKKMEQDMLRLTTAIDQAGEGIVLFNTQWVIEYVNPAYERLTGYTREELIGMDIDSVARDFLSESYPEMPHTAASRGEIWSGNARRKRKSGEVIDIRLTVSPVSSSTGNIINYVSIVQDITHQIRLQQRIVQSQKMEAIGTLAGGIAHDLKNIFTPILINSEIAAEEVGRDNHAYPLLEEIQEAAHMGADLVKQIMTFARQASEGKTPVDILSIVRETLSLLRAAIPKTIDIHTGICTDEAIVRANPTQIKQVLMNLGSNAAYAMREQNGLLEVNVTCVDLDRNAAPKISPDLAPGSYVEMSVRDTGEGIDEKTLRHIFDPFFTTKQHGEGTGMGLSVVQRIIKDHQGIVSVWSRPGEGSTFKVLLPRLENGPTDKKQTQ